MATPLQALIEHARDIQDQIEKEMANRRAAVEYRFYRGRIVFEESLRQRHRAARVNLRVFLAETRPMVVLTAPLVYSLLLPIALLDLMVTVYQAVCFRVYGIDRVRRADHVFIDRQNLAYLNTLQKLNCVYCGYSNGVIAYVREVAGRTEQYWCPIKHARRVPAPHAQYAEFLEFGEEEDFIARWAQTREDMKSDQ